MALQETQYHMESQSYHKSINNIFVVPVMSTLHPSWPGINIERAVFNMSELGLWFDFDLTAVTFYFIE